MADNNVTHRRWLSRSAGQVVIGVLVLVVGAGSAATYVRQAAQLEAVVRCNSQFREALIAQIQATAQESDAQRQLMTVLLAQDVDRSSETAKQALRDYLAALDQLERTRVTNPLPKCPRLEMGGQ